MSYLHRDIYHHGYRAFVEKSYLGIKAKNPDLPILIREALGTPPRAFARFGELTRVPRRACCHLSPMLTLASTIHDYRKRNGEAGVA